MTLLEEEKGNLQLSLVDFDEMKGRNQDRILIGVKYNCNFVFFV